MKKKILVMILGAVATVAMFAIPASAVVRSREEASDFINESQYISSASVVLEVDNLAELEAFFAATDAELIAMGAVPEAVAHARSEMEKFDA